MTFAVANFAPGGNQSKPLSGAGTATLKGAPSIWTYATNDTVAVARSSGYFNDLSSTLNVGDFIFASCDLDGTPAPVLFYVVSNTGGVVDVADGTAISTTDTD